MILAKSRVSSGPNGGPQNPGKGGWPTIRYFNKLTGYDGAPYEKKTTMSMCDELGPKGKTYMEEYVMEFGVDAAKNAKVEL